MALFQQSLARSIVVGSTTINKGNKVITSEQENNISLTIPADSVDFLIDFDVVVARILSIYIVADGGNLTLEVNDGSAPTETLNLINKEPYIWFSGSYFTNLLATDITALYATCVPASTDIGLEIYTLIDPTP